MHPWQGSELGACEFAKYVNPLAKFNYGLLGLQRCGGAQGSGPGANALPLALTLAANREEQRVVHSGCYGSQVSDSMAG